MQLTLVLPFLCAAFGLVRAFDDRLLFTIPAQETIDTFTADFEAACPTWPPAIAAGLTFLDTLVEPGDFSGKNANTEAKLVCAWSDSTRVPVTFTTDVAISLGATPTSDISELADGCLGLIAFALQPSNVAMVYRGEMYGRLTLTALMQLYSLSLLRVIQDGLGGYEVLHPDRPMTNTSDPIFLLFPSDSFLDYRPVHDACASSGNPLGLAEFSATALPTAGNFRFTHRQRFSWSAYSDLRE
ncbi:hypothetical protein C8F04DRAFT_1396759 [Mycena alexandri]|uniref:Uncharacterized protein n=1 Tax=Mycena alexandri TaxID=1745969 RepID=A0AAD6X0K3_9AGAR|nr:hypothetical protein C8F04DRAFT_1396759 [Mycena alexandri]